MIRLLAEHKALTADQVARVAFPNATRARHRLLLLVQRGVLVRFRHGRRPGSAPWTYTLGPIGASIHAARVGAPLPRPAEVTERAVRLHYAPTLRHLLGVNDFFTRLIAQGRQSPGCTLDEWWPEPKAAQACGGIVRPDGYGQWAEHGHTVGFFLEHDTGAETLATLVDKIDRYAELATGGITRPVLFHLPSTARETNLHRALARHYGHAGSSVAVATATHTDTLHGPAGRIWRTVGGTGVAGVALVELSSPRPPARSH